MHADISAFWLPKAGYAKEEYEDSFWFERQNQHPSHRYVCAIADGASETSFSNIWANLLTKHYCYCQNTGKDVLLSLKLIQNFWLQKVNGLSLPWYAEEKLHSGAFSTLTGLTIKREKCAWEAISVGDSCLFQIRGHRIITSFPYQDAHQFSLRPILLCSLPGNSQHKDQQAGRRFFGQWKGEDHFFLMTDALASWFLSQPTAGTIKSLIRIQNQSEFERFIQDLRGKRQMNGRPFLRNDDLTFLRIKVKGGD